MRSEEQVHSQVLILTEDLDFYLQLNYVLVNESIESALIESEEELSAWPDDKKVDVVVLDGRASAEFVETFQDPLNAESKIKGAPVIMLARDQTKVTAGKCSSDWATRTCVSPILPETLIKRIKLCLSAAKPEADGEREIREVKYADVEMDLKTYRVRRGDRDIHLSPIEFKLLRHFLERPEQAVSRDELKTAIWKDRIHVEPRTVDVHVGRLRRALAGQTQTNLIRTIRSVGYALYD